MATLYNGTKLMDDIVLTKQLGTVLTLDTDHKYVDKDVQFTLNVRSGAGVVTATSADANVKSEQNDRNISGVIGTKSDTAPVSGYYIKVEASGVGASTITTAGWLNTGSLGTATASAIKYFPVEEATATTSGANTVTPSVSISGNNVTLSNTNNGISVNAVGGGTASATTNVTSNAAGYIPANTVISSATIVAPNATANSSVYLSGVTIPTPESGNNTFSITVPNGSAGETLTFVFTVDSQGNTYIDSPTT